MWGGEHAASAAFMSNVNSCKSARFVLADVDLHGGGVFAFGMEGWRHFSQSRRTFSFSVTNATENSDQHTLWFDMLPVLVVK